MRCRTLVFLVVLCLALPVLAGDEQSKLTPVAQASSQQAAKSIVVATISYATNQAEALNSYSFGVKAALAIGGGGAGTGKAEFTSFNFVKRFNSQSLAYISDCVSGKKQPTVTIDLIDDKGNNVGTIKLSEVIVSSYTTGGGNGETLQDNISLNFAKIEFLKILIGL